MALAVLTRCGNPTHMAVAVNGGDEKTLRILSVFARMTIETTATIGRIGA